MRVKKAESLARKIVNEVVHFGLAESTWREMYEDAFQDLAFDYKDDLVAHVASILQRVK